VEMEQKEQKIKEVIEEAKVEMEQKEQKIKEVIEEAKVEMEQKEQKIKELEAMISALQVSLKK